jgi:type IV secretory pathway protease TraF
VSPAEPRHERDAVSLMAGLLLVLVAGLFLLTDTTDVSVDGRWAGPMVLIGVGVVGLLSALRSRGGEEEDS